MRIYYFELIVISFVLIFGCTQNSTGKKRILFRNGAGDIVRIDSTISDIIQSSANFSKLNNSDFYRLTVFDKNQNIIEESEYLDHDIWTRSLYIYENDKLLSQRGLKYNNDGIQDSFELKYQYFDKNNGHLCKITHINTNEIVRLIDFTIDSSNFRSISKTYIPKDSIFQLAETEISIFDKSWNEINTLIRNIEQETNSFTMNHYDTINRIIFDMELLDKKLVKCRFYYYKNERLNEVSAYDELLNNSILTLMEEEYY